jgi:alkylated DNA repair dioxygenase AlkB
VEDNVTRMEFEGRVPIDPLIEVIQHEGAVALHNFLSSSELTRTARVLNSLPFEPTTHPQRNARQRYEPLHYHYAHERPEEFYEDETVVAPPQALFTAAQHIDRYVGAAQYNRWAPNELIANRFEVGDSKAKHLDHATALGYIALLTAEGSQEFYFQRNNGNTFHFLMQPGTLVLFRGFSPNGQRRPYHWTAPAQVPRLSLTLLQKKTFGS